MGTEYRYEDVAPLLAPVLTAQDVVRGDLVGLSSGNVVQASDTTWGSAVTTSAPTIADVALAYGSGLTNAATDVKVSFNFPWGEGTLSSAGTATPTANGGLEIAAVALPTNAISRNIYVEDSAGSDVYKLYAVDHGGQTVITGYGIGRVPPTAVNQGALEATQFAFAQSFLGVSAQDKTANVARVVGNSVDNEIRINTAGVYDFDCASATFTVGDLVGVAKASGNALEDQKVVEVVHESLAIGVVVKAATSATTVRVRLFSRMGSMVLPRNY